MNYRGTPRLKNVPGVLDGRLESWVRLGQPGIDEGTPEVAFEEVGESTGQVRGDRVEVLVFVKHVFGRIVAVIALVMVRGKQAPPASQE